MKSFQRRMTGVLFTCIIAILIVIVGAPHNAGAEEATGSLTVHKTLGEGDTPGQPLEGITFQINRITGIDLATAEGRAQVEGLSALDAIEDPAGLGDAIFATTSLTGDGDATASFPSLPVGAYLVQEVASRSGDIDYSVVSPFIVTNPMTVDGALVYDVEVWAKNQPLTITKSVSAATIAPGERLRYTTRSLVPAPDTAGRLYRYVVRDPLPVWVSYAGAAEVRIGSERLGKDTFRVSTSLSSVVTVELTPQGLKQVAAARLGHPGLTVDISFDATVSAAASSGDRILNTAYLYADGYLLDGAGIKSNEVLTRIASDSDDNSPSRHDTASAHPGASEHTGGGQDRLGEGNTPPGNLASSPGSLAMTGSNSIMVVLAGFGLTIIGALMLITRRKDNHA